MTTSEIIAIIALLVSLTTLLINYKQNKKTRISQVQTGKLEELLASIYELSKFYSRFKNLEIKVKELNAPDSIVKVDQYFKNYDHIFIVERLNDIDALLSKIEVLYKAYSEGSTNTKVKEYFEMMDCFYMYVLNTADFKAKQKYNNEFPVYDEFSVMLGKLEALLLEDIKKYK